jgi:hypothetical protein
VDASELSEDVWAKNRKLARWRFGMRMKSGARRVYIAAIGRIWSDLSREEYWLELQLSVSVCLSQAVQDSIF